MGGRESDPQPNAIQGDWHIPLQFVLFSASISTALGKSIGIYPTCAVAELVALNSVGVLSYAMWKGGGGAIPQKFQLYSSLPFVNVAP